jgi:predicted RND superfamily exporter protein
VQRNQVKSLIASGVLVLITLALFFRSVGLALVGLVPAALTLLLTFGAMGALGIPMDVGTSMIAAIALGVGIDYAVHLVWRHGVPAAEDAQDRMVDALGATGWGIIINALEVSAGLSLLAFGTIVPMRNFGLLTASAMLVSAAATLLLIPALTRLLRAAKDPPRKAA